MSDTFYKNKDEDIVVSDIDKSTYILLSEIHELSKGDSRRSELLTVSLTIAKFSSLLVVLGEKADDAHKQNLKIQKWLVGLTIGIFMFTIALIVFGVIQIKVSNRPLIIPDHIHQQNAKINTNEAHDTSEHIPQNSN